MPEKSATISRGVTPPAVDSLFSSLRIRDVLQAATKELGLSLAVSRAVIILSPGDGQPSGRKPQPPVEWTQFEVNPEDDSVAISLAGKIQSFVDNTRAPFLVADVSVHRFFNTLRRELRTLEILSILAVPILSDQRFLGTVILYQCDHAREWREAEVSCLENFTHYLGLAIKTASSYEVIQASEDLYRRVATQSLSSLVHIDRGGEVAFLNSYFAELTGIDAEVALGEPFESLIELVVIPDDQAFVLRAFRDVIHSGMGQAPIEYRVRNRQTKKTRVLLGQLAVVRGAEGEVIGFDSFGVDITAHHQAEERLRRSEARYRRLVEHSDAIIFHTNPDQGITFISRRALDFFGMSPEDFVGGEQIFWFDLIHRDDKQRVRASVRETQKSGASFDEEFRVVNRVTGRVRWLLVRLVPVRNLSGEHASGEIEGWDGFGIDITARREAQEALVQQSKKVKALYTVSSAVSGFLDPPSIANRGLVSLCEATEADAGVCYLFGTRENQKLTLSAYHGFGPSFESKATESTIPNLAQYVASQRQSIVVADTKQDPRAGAVLADEHGLRSAVIVPLVVENDTLGALGLFSKQVGSFDGGDVLLVMACAGQIGLAARQAHLFSAYRRQASNLSALYRMSHELSRNLSTEEMFLQAFTIIRDELGLKRLWLGLLNETGTRIIGQAAFGPGWKRKLVEINVDISGREHPLARVVLTKKPVVIDDPMEVLREFGVRRVFSQLGIHSVALVPLVSSEQVLGVLAVQPGEEDSAVDQEHLMLLASLANEIATILLAKRFEERIQEGEKMRTAGLLAAGIAHNFNNLLQAILGQASLLEMQGASPDKVKRAASLITEAAAKGADLIKKLLSFAHLDEPVRERCDINVTIERNIEGLKKSLGKESNLVLNLGDELPRGFVDPRQLMQILHAIIINAREAIGSDGRVEIFTRVLLVDQMSPHYEVPYGQYVLIGVRDNGRGMDEETKRRCFEPFFTTKNVDPTSGLGMSGAGLGLAAAYALSRRNGGRITVDSRVGHGALFTIFIPVSQEVQSGTTSHLARNLEVESLPAEGNPTAETNARASKNRKRTPSDRHLRVVSQEQDGKEQKGDIRAKDVDAQAAKEK